MQDLSDQDLVSMVKEGEISAFEILVRRYQAKLVSFASRILGNKEEAEDVVSESLFRVYQTITRIDTSKRFVVYLFSIVRNAAISALRSRRLTVNLDVATVISEDEGLYERISSQETQVFIRQAVGKLDKKYKTLIDLYYFQDLSYEEIARKVHQPLNTVRTHLHRGKKSLRKILDKYEWKK